MDALFGLSDWEDDVSPTVLLALKTQNGRGIGNISLLDNEGSPMMFASVSEIDVMVVSIKDY